MKPSITIPSIKSLVPIIEPDVTYLIMFYIYVYILKIPEACPESIQPCAIKNRGIYWRRYKKQYTQNNDTSVPFKVGTWEPHTVLPIAISCPIIFSWISLTVWNLFPFKGDFSFGKSQKMWGTKSESPGWLDVSPKISTQDVMHEHV